MAASADWSRDGRTHDSGSLSGLTSLDGESDDFNRALRQHVRDQQRVDQFLTGSAQPFRKARPLHLNDDNFFRGSDSASHSSGASDPGVHEHSYTNGSEPAFNIPRDWGRKGRTRTSWLRRGLAQDDIATARPTNDEELVRRGLDNEFDAEEMRRASNRPFAPNGFEHARSIRGQRATSSPNTHGQQNDTVDRLGLWEADQELTTGSMLQGTPIARSGLAVRRYELDPVQSHKRDRDLLSRITEKDTTNMIRPHAESRLSRKSDPALVRNLRHSPEDKKWGGARAIGANKENIPFRNNIGMDHGASSGVHGESERNESRKDAIEILKRLASATSKSPAASPSYLEDKHDPENKQARSSRQASAQAPEVVSNGEATPYNPARQLPAKTPQVMGAWIDTPLPARHDSASPTNIKTEHSTRETADIPPINGAAPPQPSSALHNLLHPQLSSSEPLSAGDETLASLAAILDPTHNTLDLSATLNLDEIRAELDELHSLKRPLSKTQAERRDELLAIESMSERLRAARRGVKEVGKGLRDVEKRVGELGVSGMAEADVMNGRVACENCAKSVWRGAWDEAMSVLVTRREVGTNLHSRLYGPRKLTWLGTLLLAVATWWAIERSLCSLYCHPRTAASMTSYGVDPGAPRYPFVLPTVIFRPIRWLWSPLSSIILWLAGTMWSGVVSYLSILFEPDKPMTQRMASASISHPKRPSSIPSPVMHARSVRAIYDGSHNTGVQHRDAAVSHGDKVQERQPQQDDSYDTMDADTEVDMDDRPVRGFRLGKLWSWRASPEESAKEYASSPSHSKSQPRSRHDGRETLHAEDDIGATGSWNHDVDGHVSDEDDLVIESVGNIWETGDGGRGVLGQDDAVDEMF